MHARVSIFEDAAPGAVEREVAVAREQILPAVRRLPGYSGMISLNDPASGKAVTITLWQSEPAMRASEQAANGIRERHAALTDGLRVAGVERYQVTVFEVEAPAPAYS